MKITIFCGPTLTDIDRADCKAALERARSDGGDDGGDRAGDGGGDGASGGGVEVLPPAGQGDVFRATLRQPAIIALIDGRFDQVDAVAHKEVLWAMAHGIHVLGAASMGALRAAELAPFGMRGVGEIYEQVVSGALEDDDEVAVAHGGADVGYRALSVAMVDIRATLAAAVAGGVVSRAVADALAGIAKACFYPDRSYPLLLARAAEAGVDGDALARLREFLPGGRVDAKRRDALALLDVVRELAAGELPPMRVRYHFSDTDAWRSVRRRAMAAVTG